MKTTKRALFSSVMALILCFSMLVGTTFAWFTDEVKSDVNKIVAGNLDVDVLVDGESIQDKSVLFDEIKLWEPGVVAYENITVKNLGTLALKYQLSVNFSNENYVVEADGTVTDNCLADVLKVSVIEETIAANLSREAVLAMAGEGVLLSELVKSGELESMKNQAYAIIIWWPQSENDDTFNINNGKTTTDGEALHINLGLKVLATQLDAEIESDSFGPDYDEDAWVDGMQVFSAQDLQAAINAGETDIVLMDDIVADEAIVIPASTTATYSLRSSINYVTINLNGKTISNETGYVFENKGNLAITGNGTITGLGGIRSTAGNVLIENGNFYCSSRWQDSTYQHTLKAENTNVIINGGRFDATVNGQTNAVLNASTGSTITINGGSFRNVSGELTQFDPYLFTYEKDGKVIINDGTFYGGWRFNGVTATTDIYGGIFTVGFDGQSFNASSTHDVTVYGGTFASQTYAKLTEKVSDIVAEGYEAVANADGTFSVIFPQESFDSLIENAGENATIEVPAGTYTFPGNKLQAGQTLNCAPGTVFNGKTGFNINGATVIGATFTNQNGYLVNSTTINGTFKDCVFTDCDGLRYCYAGETVVFENCVFDTDFYGVHFDGGANDVIFKNCSFTGFNTFGSAVANLTMEGCTFQYNGKGGYNGINLWGDSTLKDCTFVFDGTAAYEWVDLCYNNKTVTFTNCVVTDGETEKGIETVVGDYGAGNTITVDGTPLVFSNDALKAAVADGATKIMLANGEYDLNGNQKNGLTLIGVGNDVKVANTTRFASGKAVGAITKAINLENVTITNTVYTMEDGGNAVFTNVYFAAGFREGYGKAVVFNNCTFGSNSEGYALHFQSDSASEGGLITLNGCTFEGGKVHLGGKRAYAFNGCDFAAGTDFQVWSNITLENCTVNGEKVVAENMATLFPNLNAEKVTLK